MAVPGELKAYHEAWHRFGRVPWSRLFLPAITLAEDGFMVTPDLAGIMIGREAFLQAQPSMRSVRQLQLRSIKTN